MRSKIGTKARLAAHILALLLLLLMLVYITPNVLPRAELKPMRPTTVPARQPSTVQAKSAAPRSSEARTAVSETVDPTPLARHAPPGKADTLDKAGTPVVATRIPASRLRPPGAASGAVNEDAPPMPGITARPMSHAETLREAGVARPVTEPLRPPAATGAADSADSAPESHATSGPVTEASGPDTSAIDSTVADAQSADRHVEELAPFPRPRPEEHALIEQDDGYAEHGGEAAAPEPGDEPEKKDAGENASGAEAEVSQEIPAEHIPATAQPDESGALVVAASEAGDAGSVAATTPLANANLEVLGDGIFWLDPRHDLEKELAAVPDIGTLVLLTPLPGFHADGFEHIKTEAIPADAADLTHDSAEHFLHILSEANRPVVVAPLTGARAAAFFKGAYLLAHRNLSTVEVMREIGPELDQAGEARDEIVHRLLRLEEAGN